MAAEALEGSSFEHKWQLKQALAQASEAWNAKKPGPLTKDYNKGLGEQLEDLYRHFHSPAE